MIRLAEFIADLRPVPSEESLEILRRALAERLVDAYADRRPDLWSTAVNERSWQFRLWALWHAWSAATDFACAPGDFTPQNCANWVIPVADPFWAAAQLNTELIVPRSPYSGNGTWEFWRHYFGAGGSVSRRDKITGNHAFFRPAYDGELAAQLGGFIHLSCYYLLPVRRSHLEIPAATPPGSRVELFYVGKELHTGEFLRGGSLFSGQLEPGSYSIYDERFALPEAEEDESLTACGYLDMTAGLQYLI